MMTHAPFNWPLRVYYEDTDAGGVVYHASYLRFMERARTEWLRSFGFEQDELRNQHGVLFAVKSMQIDFRRPARFNDQLNAWVNLHEAKRASLSFAQAIQRPDGECLCSAEVRIACLQADSFRPTAIPDLLLQRIFAT